MLQQYLEDVERLLLESDPKAMFANLAVPKIHLERAEADDPRGWSDFVHDGHARLIKPNTVAIMKVKASDIFLVVLMVGASSSLRWQPNAAEQVCEATIRVQRVKSVIDLEDG